MKTFTQFLEETYSQVYQEDWKSPNLRRMTSRLGSLEQQIPNNRRDSPEYARYRRVSDVASSARNNPNKPFTRPAGDDYLNSVWNKFSSRLKPTKGNTSRPQTTQQGQGRSFRSGVGGGRFGGGRGEMLDKFGDYTRDLKNRGVTDYKPGGRYGISGIGLADEYDLYDIILSHLLDEGYAETPDAAKAIVVNMSEEWIYFILEKKKQYDDGHGFDRSKHPDLDIDYDRPRGKDQDQSIRGYTRIHHKPSGITYEVNHDKRHSSDDEDEHMYDAKLQGKARKAHGHKPEHNIRWDHSKPWRERDKMTKGEKIKAARDAKRVWDKHIKHRIPSGHLVSNEPDENSDDKRRDPDKNTRASIYKKSGFGKVNHWGVQYSAKIGNKLHPVNDDEGDDD